MMKPTAWFGIYSATGKLIDVTPGELHAQEIAEELTKQKRAKHTVLPVIITPVTT